MLLEYYVWFLQLTWLLLAGFNGKLTILSSLKRSRGNDRCYMQVNRLFFKIISCRLKVTVKTQKFSSRRDESFTPFLKMSGLAVEALMGVELSLLSGLERVGRLCTHDALGDFWEGKKLIGCEQFCKRKWHQKWVQWQRNGLKENQQKQGLTVNDKAFRLSWILLIAFRTCVIIKHQIQIFSITTERRDRNVTVNMGDVNTEVIPHCCKPHTPEKYTDPRIWREIQQTTWMSWGCSMES